MDGQCQDEFLHCADPGSDHERIHVTFRWIIQHVAFCSFLRTGVACCLPTCARVFFCPWYGVGGDPWCLVHRGGTSFASFFPCVYRAWVSKMCLLLDPPFGRRSVGALSLLLLGSLLGSTKNCLSNWWGNLENSWFRAGLACIRSYDACMVYWAQGASLRNCRKNKVRPFFFSPSQVFLFSRTSRVRFWCLILWYLWIGRAKHPGPARPVILLLKPSMLGVVLLMVILL